MDIIDKYLETMADMSTKYVEIIEDVSDEDNDTDRWCNTVTRSLQQHQGGQFFLGLVPRSLTAAASATDKVRIISNIRVNITCTFVLNLV